MKAIELYNTLDKDFQCSKLKDDWSFMNFHSYINPKFRDNYIGVMLDNSEEIKKVYTATFPDVSIIEEILSRNETDVMLFSHHAMGYDGSIIENFPFYNIPQEYVKELKQRRISFYVMHVPLDKNGQYSTSVNLANALKLNIVQQFCRYESIDVGVICKTSFNTLDVFGNYLFETIGHDVKIRQYGDNDIKENLVAIAAGGGSYPFVAEELRKLGINVYLTGFTRPIPTFEPTMEFHRIAENSKINVIGATHYSTEKFACISMVDYFKALGLESEFLHGEYYLQDL